MRAPIRLIHRLIPALLLGGWSISASAQESKPLQPAQSEAQAIYDIIGTWKVERLWTNRPSENGYKIDDPTALGSLLTVAPETIHWSYPGGPRFVEVGVCTGPKPILIGDANRAKNAAASLAPALHHFAVNAAQLSPAYEMKCTGGGHWGPVEAGGNSYQMVGNTRMIIRWYDGAILLLKRYGD